MRRSASTFSAWGINIHRVVSVIASSAASSQSPCVLIYSGMHDHLLSLQGATHHFFSPETRSETALEAESMYG